MSIGNEIAYRRGKRGRDATGSLVFDTERKRAQRQGAEKAPKPADDMNEKMPLG